MIPSSLRYSEESPEHRNFGKTPESSPVFEASDADPPQPFLKREKSLPYRRPPNRPPRSWRSRTSQDFRDIHPDRHVTRDSMVEGLVLSLNQPPEIDSPSPIRESFDSESDLGYPGLLLSSPIHGTDQAARSDSYSSPDPPAQPAPASLSHTVSNLHVRRKTVDQPNFGLVRQGLGFGRAAKLPKAQKLKPDAAPSEELSSSVERPHAMENMVSEHNDASPNSSLVHEAASHHPRDHMRHRSRSNNFSGSILDRARPVPVEYHTFEEPGRNGRAGLRKSLSYPSPYQFPAQSSSRPSSVSRPTQAISDAPDNAALQRNSRNNTTALLSPNAAAHSLRPGNNTGAYVRQHSTSPSINGSDPSLAASLLQGQGSSRSYASGAPVRERHGFFRRVFGSSKSSTSLTDPRQKPPQLPPLQVDDAPARKQPRASVHDQPQAASVIELARGPLNVSQQPSKQPPQVLNKKTSFFRRRRKTLSGKDVPTIAIQQHTLKDNQNQASQQPTKPSTKHSPSSSSLRKVMDPYLAEAQGPQSPLERYYDTLEEQPQTNPNKTKGQQDVYEFLRTSSPGMVAQPSQFRPKPRAEPSDVASSQINERLSSLSSIQRGTLSVNTVKNDGSEGPEEPRQEIRSVSHSLSLPHSSQPGSNPALPSSNDQIPLQKVGDEYECDPVARRCDGSNPDSSRKASTTARPDVPSDKKSGSDAHEDDWMLATPAMRDGSSSRAGSSRSNRLWLQEEESELNDQRTSGNVPDDAAITTSRDMPHQLQAGSNTLSPAPAGSCESPSPFSSGERADFFCKSTADEQQRAKRIFEGDVDASAKARGAAVLGEAGTSADRLRAAYMSFFDFSGLNILLGLRDLCGRLVLKGETQQVDRVLAAFSRRWCVCNHNHGFRSQGKRRTPCPKTIAKINSYRRRAYHMLLLASAQH